MIREELSNSIQQENLYSNDLSIDISIHRETGLIVVDKIGMPDQGIELTIEDVEALMDFVKNNRDRLAHSSDFQ